jgi:hypothetical protein
MLNTVRAIGYISNYLTDTLIPRVNAILDELGSHRQGTVALGWEVYISTLPASKWGSLLSSLTPTRYWMPILAIAALLIAYSIIVESSHYSAPTSEIGLLLLNIAFLIYLAVQNTATVRRSMARSRKLQITGVVKPEPHSITETKTPRDLSR